HCDTDVIVLLHSMNAVIGDHFSGADLGRRLGPRCRGDANVSIGDHADDFAVISDYWYSTTVAFPHQLGDNGEVSIWRDGSHIGGLQLLHCHGGSSQSVCGTEATPNAPTVPSAGTPSSRVTGGRPAQLRRSSAVAGHTSALRSKWPSKTSSVRPVRHPCLRSRMTGD